MKKNTKLLWVFGVLIILAGISLLFSLITPSHYLRTSGSLSSETTSNGLGREITFTSEEGIAYKVRSRGSIAPHTSNTVVVAYDPADPAKTMKIVSENNTTVLWGILIVMAGGGLLYLGYRSRHTPGNADSAEDQASKPNQSPFSVGQKRRRK